MSMIDSVSQHIPTQPLENKHHSSLIVSKLHQVNNVPRQPSMITADAEKIPQIATGSEQPGGIKTAKLSQVNFNLEKKLNDLIEHHNCRIVARGPKVMTQSTGGDITYKNYFDSAVGILHDLSLLSNECLTKFVKENYGEGELLNKVALFKQIVTNTLDNLTCYLPGGSRENNLILMTDSAEENSSQLMKFKAHVLIHRDNALLVLNHRVFTGKTHNPANSLSYARNINSIIHECTHMPVHNPEKETRTIDTYYFKSEKADATSKLPPFRSSYYAANNSIERTENNEASLQLERYSNFFKEYIANDQEFKLKPNSEEFRNTINNAFLEKGNNLKRDLRNYHLAVQDNDKTAKGDVEQRIIKIKIYRDKLLESGKKMINFTRQLHDALKKIDPQAEYHNVTTLFTGQSEPELLKLDAIEFDKIKLYLKRFIGHPEGFAAVQFKTASDVTRKILMLAGETGSLETNLYDPLLPPPAPSLPWSDDKI